MGEDDPDLEQHRHLNFEEYGVGQWNATRRSALEDDPYVNVEPVLEHIWEDVVAWMGSEGLIQEMEAVAGPSWPIPQDFGVSRFLHVSESLAGLIRLRFPNL